MFEELANARTRELEAQAREIRQRMECEAISRIDRLERALETAKSRLSNLRSLSTGAK